MFKGGWRLAGRAGDATGETLEWRGEGGGVLQRVAQARVQIIPPGGPTGSYPSAPAPQQQHNLSLAVANGR